MKNISLSRIDAASVVELWQESPFSTVFTHPHILATMTRQVDWWLCSKGAEPLCLWPVCFDREHSIINPDFTYYVGPFFTKFGANAPGHRKFSTELATFNTFLEEFTNRYQVIKASLPIGMDDVRSFSWWNYHSRDLPRVSITPRYTARIENLKQLSVDQIIAGLRPVRRREFKRTSLGEEFVESTDWDFSEITDLYRTTLDRNGVKLESNTYEHLRNIIELGHSDFGNLRVIRESGHNGNIACVTLVMSAKETDNLVLNLVDPQHRSSGLSVYVLVNLILDAKASNRDNFDFNGANSPDRGDDKHSYGSKPRLYFDLEYSGQDLMGDVK